MRRWSFVAVVLLLGGAVNVSYGQGAQGVDCTILGELTRRHTFRRLEEHLGADARPRSPRIDDFYRLQICDDTAVSVSYGFSAAMSQFGLPVRWHVADSAQVCSLADIDQCFPFADPAGAPLSLELARVVASTWYEVRSAVVAHMPWGTSSNVSYFSADSMISVYGSDGPIRAGSMTIEPALLQGW